MADDDDDDDVEPLPETGTPNFNRMSSQEGDPSVLSVVEFASHMMYMSESGQVQKIEILRVSSERSLRSSCSVRCLSEGGKHEKYDKVNKLVKFGPGELSKIIEVNVHDDSTYDYVIEEANLVLESPVNCTINPQLCRARVKIIDNDVFPSCRFETQIKDDYTTDDWRAKGNNDIMMMLDYVKSAFWKTFPGSLKWLLADQLNNLIYISRLVIMRRVIYALDADTLEDTTDSETLMILVLCGIGLLVPNGITHYLNYRRQFWKVGGGARKQLLSNLMQKYLYYEEATRDRVDISEFKMIFLEASFELVSSGYMQFFVLAAAVGRIVMVLCFVLYLAVSLYAVDSQPQVFTGTIPFFAMPAVLLLFHYFRRKGSEKLREEVVDAKVSLVTHLNNWLKHTCMVIAYFARPLVMDQCSNKIGSFNGKLVDQGARQANDMAFFGWVERVAEFAVVFAGGLIVASGEMDLSTFTAILSALLGCSSQLRSVYLAEMEINASFPSLWQLVQYINHPTDLRRRLDLEGKRYEEFNQKLTELSKIPSDKPPLDRIDLEFHNVSFSYPVTPSESCSANDKSARVIKDVTLSIKQGQMVAIAGHSACGSRTMMRLLAGELLPDPGSGRVSVPPHLRVLYVGFEPELWEGPLALNVFFGLMASKSAFDHLMTLGDLTAREVNRGLRICKRLNIPKNVIDDIRKYMADVHKDSTSALHTLPTRPHTAAHDSPTSATAYNKVLREISDSTRVKIQLACALIADPSVLVLNKPLQMLTIQDAECAMECLWSYVNGRGLERSSKAVAGRRPRTCIMTSNSPLLLSGADEILTVCADGSVRSSGNTDEFQVEAEQSVKSLGLGLKHYKETWKAELSDLSPGGGNTIQGGGAFGVPAPNDLEMHRRRSDDEGDPNSFSIVQFACHMAYMRESEEQQSIQIMRIGSLDTKCSVRCHSEKNQFPKKFDPIDERIEFLPGVCSNTIKMQVHENSSYDSVVEVNLTLDKPSNCTLGKELYKMRVKIIDNDVFPSNKFKAQLDEDFTTESWRRLGQHTDLEMVWELAKLLFWQTTPGSFKMILADSVDNIIYISRLLVNRSIIQALNSDEEEMPSAEELFMYALALLLPYGVTHLLKYRRQYWKVGGGARKLLLHGLMEKYLYYEEATRDCVDLSEFKVTFSDSALELVDKGYMKFFVLGSCLGRILMSFLFLSYLAVYNIADSDEEEGMMGQFAPICTLLPFLVLPICIAAFWALRLVESRACREKVVDAKVELFNHMNNWLKHTTMITAYFARPLVMTQCSKKVNELNACLVSQGSRMANDLAFFDWLRRATEFAVVIAIGNFVVTGVVELGDFTAILSALLGISGQFRNVYENMIQIQESYPSLWQVVHYMNHPTDLQARMNFESERLKMFDSILEKLQGEGASDVGKPVQDLMDLQFKNVTFSYPPKPSIYSEPDPSSGKPVFQQLTATIKQGELVGFTGKSVSGTKTLMRLLAGELMPQKGGQVFIPPHLRALYVGLEPELWDGSIALNVFFGLMISKCKHNHLTELGDLTESQTERGIKICKRLQIPESVVEAIQESLAEERREHPLDKGAQRDAIKAAEKRRHEILRDVSDSTRVKIQLACALISDPPVLVLNKPLRKLSLVDAESVMQCLRSYVDNRGLERPPETMLKRRPRTCIITSNSPLLLHVADEVFNIHKGGPIENQHDMDKYRVEAQEMVRSSAEELKSYKEQMQSKLLASPASSFHSEPADRDNDQDDGPTFSI